MTLFGLKDVQLLDGERAHCVLPYPSSRTLQASKGSGLGYIPHTQPELDCLVPAFRGECFSWHHLAQRFLRVF